MRGDITNNINYYIEQNKLSVNQIAADTKIPASKLLYGTKEKLTAEELLILCQYLNIKPENFV